MSIRQSDGMVPRRPADESKPPVRRPAVFVASGRFVDQIDLPTWLRMLLTWPPRKIRAMIATIAIRARISAYSARPWPSSSRRSEARNEVNSAMCGSLLDDDALDRELGH